MSIFLHRHRIAFFFLIRRNENKKLYVFSFCWAYHVKKNESCPLFPRACMTAALSAKCARLYDFMQIYTESSTKLKNVNISS